MNAATTESWEFRQVPISHPDAARLVEEVQQEYVVRYGSRDATPLEPGVFDPPVGAFFVVYDGEDPVATGAWRRRTDVAAYDSTNAAEVKRMYVTTAARGLGLGRIVLAHLESSARAAGAEVMVLETGLAQPEAMALYESAGYSPIPNFGHYRDSPQNRCYAKTL